MNDIRSRLAELGRVQPSRRLDVRIAALIADAGARAAPRGLTARRARLALAATIVVLAIGLALVVVLGGDGSRLQTPPGLVVELPLNPALERVLRCEPASFRPFFSREFADVETLFIAGTPVRSPADGG
jgi:hypothetical protein